MCFSVIVNVHAGLEVHWLRLSNECAALALHKLVISGGWRQVGYLQGDWYFETGGWRQVGYLKGDRCFETGELGGGDSRADIVRIYCSLLRSGRA